MFLQLKYRLQRILSQWIPRNYQRDSIVSRFLKSIATILSSKDSIEAMCGKGIQDIAKQFQRQSRKVWIDIHLATD